MRTRPAHDTPPPTHGGRHANAQRLGAYHSCVSALCRRFRTAFPTSPEHLGSEQVRAYQLFLVQDKQLAWPTVVQTVCALRFLYRVILGRPTMLDSIPHPRRPFTLPTILSQAEVAVLLTTPRNLKHRAILTTLSATGLRNGRAMPVAGH